MCVLYVFEYLLSIRLFVCKCERSKTWLPVVTATDVQIKYLICQMNLFIKKFNSQKYNTSTRVGR